MASMFDSVPLSPRPRPLTQSPAYFRALLAAGEKPRRLADETLLTTRRLPAGLRVTRINRADLEPQLLPLLVKDAGMSRHPFLLAPDRPCPDLARLGALRIGRSPAAIELPLDGDLAAGLDPVWRHRLGHAVRHDVSVSCTNLPMDPGHWIFGDQRTDRRRRLPPSVLTLAYAAANPGDAKLFTAHVGPTRIAATLILLHDSVATWHMARTTPHGQARAAHYQLLWEAMCWLAERNYNRFDLGSLGSGAPDTDAFRLGTGAMARPLGDVWAWWPPAGRLAPARFRKPPPAPARPPARPVP
ncbi:MAG: GNAT family N-acetyltransferase [Rhodobacteraceae bacterium]|nr:GNAT family N-acetyltransferase [Paracoccaceae bacterium]QEW21158.1 hypothetical protein LA6_003364 [Marinibacterium anthonyi]